jgi:mRNA-degrading endonuclease RelE of RelBE toxin-antitoxin system
MAYSIIATPEFKRELKVLARKYRSLVAEMEELLCRLAENPAEGVSLGRNCYKIRLAIQSKGKGKSSGARVITFVQITGTTVFLLTIFDKSQKEDISDKDLKVLLSHIP